MANSKKSSHPNDHQNLLVYYSRARVGLGILGIALILGLTLHGLFVLDEFKHSISHTYHSALGDFLVGALWAIGIFLIVYRDYDPDDDPSFLSLFDLRRNWDRWVAIIAGLGAIGVAFFPVDPSKALTCVDLLSGSTEAPCYPTGSIGHGQVFGNNVLHFISAFVFFICIFIFCIFIFPSRKMPGEEVRLKKFEGRHRPRRERPETVYAICGSVILFCIFGLYMYSQAEREAPGFYVWLESWRAFFVLEAIAVLAFSIAWIRRSREYIVKE